jgi:hypothetical protein
VGRERGAGEKGCQESRGKGLQRMDHGDYFLMYGEGSSPSSGGIP